MFQAYLGPSSGGTTVCIQQFVVIILFKWLSWLDCSNPTRTTDSHLKRIISINCCIRTVVPADDGPRYAQNMYRMTKYTMNKLCIKLGFLYAIISRCTVNKIWYIYVNRTGGAKQIDTLNNFKPCNLSRLRPYFLFIIMVETMQTSHERKRTITNIKRITGMLQEYFFLNRKKYSFGPTLMLRLRIFAFCYRPDWGTHLRSDGCSSQHFPFYLRPNEPVAPSMRSSATHCWHNVSTLKNTSETALNYTALNYINI